MSYTSSKGRLSVEHKPMPLKRIFYSRIFTCVIILIAGGASAYRYMERQKRWNDARDKQRIEADVKESIDDLNLDNVIKPLVEAGTER
ncbi:MAG: hypothetical protein J0M26_04400 [Planctomycetes bacterium]|nr:hypothetical protein [Planctomycetota bacterium]